MPRLDIARKYRKCPAFSPKPRLGSSQSEKRPHLPLILALLARTEGDERCVAAAVGIVYSPESPGAYLIAYLSVREVLDIGGVDQHVLNMQELTVLS